MKITILSYEILVSITIHLVTLLSIPCPEEKLNLPYVTLHGIVRTYFASNTTFSAYSQLKMRMSMRITIGLVVLAVLVVVSPLSGIASAATTVTIKDIAAQAGVSGTTETRDASTVDYNNDGLEDVYIGQHDQGSKLMRNNGDGTYTQVANATWTRFNTNKKIVDRHQCA